jgi:hypothetical protein
MHDFFDSTVQENIYGKRSKQRPTTAPAQTFEQRRTALIRGPLGRVEIDRKVLVEDCSADFRDAWFYKGATRAVTHRWDRSAFPLLCNYMFVV